MESLKAHPMASNFLVTFPQLISIMSFKDFEEVKNYTPDASVLETPDFKKKAEESEWLKNSAESFKETLLGLDFVKHLNSNT